MVEKNEINVYSDLGEKTKEVASKIEILLNGLSVYEIYYMFSEIKRNIFEKTKIALLV